MLNFIFFVNFSCYDCNIFENYLCWRLLKIDVENIYVYIFNKFNKLFRNLGKYGFMVRCLVFWWEKGKGINNYFYE